MSTVTRRRFLASVGQTGAVLLPGLGTRTIDGASWLPYQQPTSPTPPFPEYPSGHSTFSAARAAILRYYTGSDLDGRATGRAAAAAVWEKANLLWRGGEPRRGSVGAPATDQSERSIASPR
jgi:hypothetical protein